MARLRLEINLTTGRIDRTAPTRRLNSTRFATTIVRDVALTYADSRYRELRDSISGQIKADAEREIQSIARRYDELIVGAGGRRASTFTLESAQYGGSRGGRAAFEYVTRPQWKPLTDKYVSWKVRNGYSPNHFLKAGELKSAMGRGSTWTELFGPVEVRVIRTLDSDQRPQGFPKNPIQGTGLFQSRRGGTDHRFSIAKIEVRALGQITASMIPALRGGNIEFAQHANSALVGQIYGKDPELGYRLFGNSKTTPYRSTVEPFLGFVLTRAIPAAVHNRILQIRNPGRQDLGQATKRFK